MTRHEINSLTLVIWVLCSIFLLLVQFGYISPIGLIVVTSEQYVWLFWFSALVFILSTANLVARIKKHPGWSEGFSGEIVRTFRVSGQEKEYLVQGKGETSIKHILSSDWPFDEYEHSSVWYVVDEQGNDITNQPLSSIDGTASVIFEDNRE